MFKVLPFMGMSQIISIYSQILLVGFGISRGFLFFLTTKASQNQNIPGVGQDAPCWNFPTSPSPDDDPRILFGTWNYIRFSLFFFSPLTFGCSRSGFWCVLGFQFQGPKYGIHPLPEAVIPNFWSFSPARSHWIAAKAPKFLTFQRFPKFPRVGAIGCCLQLIQKRFWSIYFPEELGSFLGKYFFKEVFF